MSITYGLRKLLFAGLLLSAGIALAATPRSDAAAAHSEQVLYSFCSQANCADGRQPNGGLIMDAAGNLYGTAAIGGSNTCSSYPHACGVVFKLAPDPSGAGWTETVIYNFCSRTGCADGQLPLAGLVMDAAGNLYGTTAYGGNQWSGGVAFQLTPNPNGSWTETVIYTFCQRSSCADGAQPEGPMIMDAAGNLYGTTYQGNNGHGTVFRLTPNQGSTAWTETTLYAFCQQSGCYDGDKTYAGLVMDGAGNLYGTTYQGGLSSNLYNKGAGVVFKLAPNQHQSGWGETVLYRFCPQGGYCTDGVTPNGGLIIDGENLYGSTGAGGSGDSGHGGGVAFQLTPNQGGWAETVLYNFCSNTNCADGFPQGGLISDAAGNLYGMAVAAVFELMPNQSKTAWTETVLYTFCSQANCVDGDNPNGGLLLDAAGNVYGATDFGGTSGGGVIFTLSTGNYALTVSETGSGKVTSSPAGRCQDLQRDNEFVAKRRRDVHPQLRLCRLGLGGRQRWRQGDELAGGDRLRRDLQRELRRRDAGHPDRLPGQRLGVCRLGRRV
jgi:uncharacterized repeat protein (TIGR03803 family)